MANSNEKVKEPRMTVKHFKHNRVRRVFQILYVSPLILVLVALLFYVVFSIGKFLVEFGLESIRHTKPAEALPPLEFLCLSSLIVLAGIFTISFMIVNMLSMYPSISVRESGIKIDSLITAGRWLDWSAIKKVRRAPLMRESWFVGIEGLGPLYWLHGLVFWLGTGGIHITQQIQGYSELIKYLRSKRPDLFGW